MRRQFLLPLCFSVMALRTRLVPQPHSARFRYANGTRDEMKVMFEDMAGDRLEVVLGQRDHTLYFTKTHRHDLLAVIAAIAVPKSRVNES